MAGDRNGGRPGTMVVDPRVFSRTARRPHNPAFQAVQRNASLDNHSRELSTSSSSSLKGASADENSLAATGANRWT
jgi:hypothetical protein